MKKLLVVLILLSLPCVAAAEGDFLELTGTTLYLHSPGILNVESGGTDTAINFCTDITAAGANINCWAMEGADGDLVPDTTGAYDIGSAAAEIDNIYVQDLVASADLTVGGGDLILTGDPLNAIYSNAGTNTSQILIGIESAATSATGASIALHGIADATVGEQGTLVLAAGVIADADADVRLYSGDALGDIEFYSSTPTLQWYIDGSTGDIVAGAGAGDIEMAAGKSLQYQESDAAKACMGTATLNAAADVTVTTTCATTASRIFLTRTSLDADTTGDAYVKTKANGSFVLFSEANDTATVDWIIFNEAS